MVDSILQPGRRLSPGAAVALGFLALVIAGAFLLATPLATQGPRLALIDALFTATSAACVTGLTVVDTGARFSVFGRTVLLLLFQIGGLGILIVTSFFALLMRRDLGLGERFTLWKDLRGGGIRGMRKLLLGVVAFSLLIEAVGALLLHLSAGPIMGVGPERGFSAVFHAVSAFCNAGFSLHTESMGAYATRPAALLVVCALVMLGGLGFLLCFELIGRLRGRRPRRLSLQARIVLAGSALLWLGGTLLFLWSERNGALAGRGWDQRLLIAFFQSVTCRTAGFDLFPVGELSPVGGLTSLLLMFVGAAPGSTGGGVKVSTLVMVLLLLAGYFRGREHVELAGRRIPDSVLRESLAVLSAGLVLVLGGTLILMLVDPVAGADLQRSAFEVVSAFATVGLSSGLSGELGPTGKLILALLMFTGRVGLLTLALAVSGGLRKRRFRLPDEGVMVG